MNNRNVAVAAVAVLVILGISVVILATPGAQSSSTSGPSPSLLASSSSISATRAANDYYFLVFTQKGIAELTSPDGTVYGYSRLYNISDSIPTQTFYWEGYPVQGAARSNFLVPLNNGTVEVVDSTKMRVTGTISAGNATGFIGVSISPDDQYAAIADGPSGVVEVVKLSPVQTVWEKVYNRPAAVTAYPCDVRWSSDGSALVVPMRNNDTVDVISAATGDILGSTVLSTGSKPYMLSLNTQGDELAVELSGNKTVAFYSYPALKPLGITALSVSSFSPTRGVFTLDGSYYLEDSGSTNVVAVISTSTFAVVNTINLPPSSSPGLADMEITPDGLNAYVVMHGTPATGGIIYLIPLSSVTTATGASGSLPLTVAPAFAVPISTSFGAYLADNVLSPPVTGLHC
jgi:DNA-binding beta-propeller fold protein YncE